MGVPYLIAGTCVWSSPTSYNLAGVYCTSQDGSYEFALPDTTKVDISIEGINGRAPGNPLLPNQHYYLRAVSTEGEAGYMLFTNKTHQSAAQNRLLPYAFTTLPDCTIRKAIFCNGEVYLSPKIVIENLPIQPNVMVPLNLSPWIPEGVLLMKLRVQSYAPTGSSNCCIVTDDLNNDASKVVSGCSSVTFSCCIGRYQRIHYKSIHPEGSCSIVIVGYSLPP